MNTAQNMLLEKNHANTTGGEGAGSWSGKSLAGKWRHRFFYGIIRLFGVKTAKIPLFFVAAIYSLRPGIASRAKPYLIRRFPNSSAAGILLHVFRLYRAFGTVLLERAAGGILHTWSVSPDKGCIDTLQALLHQEKGLIVLSAHVGSWQTALAGLQQETTVNIVQPRGGADIDLHLFEHGKQQNVHTHFCFIDPTGDFGGLIAMRTALARGEIVCLMGDRMMPAEKNGLECRFLGGAAMFPGTAYGLAAITGAPVAVVLTRRNQNGTISCRCEDFFSVPAQAGRRKNLLREYAERFAKTLEQYAQREPYQFYNFYNLWRQR